jgi:hypothetical protein
MSILALTTNTLTSPAAAGNIEYSSPIFAATPISTERGIVPTQQYYRVNTAIAGSNATGAQSIFGVGVTLSASTVYEFEMVMVLSKTAGTTSHTISMGFGGTATVNNIGYVSFNNGNSGSAVSTGVVSGFILTASATVASPAITGASINQYFVLKGTVSINAGGTFIPQYTLSAAPGGAYSTNIGSFIRIAPVSASGSNTSVGAWA